MENKSISRRILEEAFSKGELGVIDQFVSPNVVDHDPARPPGPAGIEGLRQMIGVYRTAFPDLRITVDDQLAEGDRVVTRWTATGTQRGPLGDIPASGRRATVTGITIDKFVGGKLVEMWTNWDTAGMMQQLGVVPKEKVAVGGDGKRAQQPMR